MSPFAEALGPSAWTSCIADTTRQAADTLDRERGAGVEYARALAEIIHCHAQAALTSHAANLRQDQAAWGEAAVGLLTAAAGPCWIDYLLDSGQRAMLFADVLRRRGNAFVEHEEGHTRTILNWDHRLVLDGRELPRPVNYSLVRIVPPAGVAVREDGRPYVIIDPRAGHGSGIGGFKHESEVGAAIHQGHPTYFLTFTRLPVPGQTLADVAAAEAEFVRRVRRLHPDAPKPVVIGNCQGGWAAMLLAATNPDITGPVVANGAPLSYWAGQRGQPGLRYLSGLVGGATTVRLLSDLGNGRFDGAHLVFNFERLSPTLTWWTKYADLWANIDSEAERFLEFERWWSSFFYMTPAEIEWIVENLFVGNRLGRGSARLDAGKHIDLRTINAPIVLFASHGDNITPPLQALGWIADHYRDVEEIRARGQRIVYTLHEHVGHLGIFVSSSVANKEHEQIVSTLKAIEALAPGLYEMQITEQAGGGIDKVFKVAFAPRSITEMMAECGSDDADLPFGAVARCSELAAEVYDLTLRPLVRGMTSQASADALAHLGPMRLPRWLQSDRNPLMQPVAGLAEQVRAARRPASDDNPWRLLERWSVTAVTQWWNGVRDLQNAGMEWTFHQVWAAPAVQAIGHTHTRRISDARSEDLRTLSAVQDALDRMTQGGFAAGVVRMLILLAQSRKEVRRSRLERANRMLMTSEPFASMAPKRRTRLIHRESLIVGLEPDAALETLPELLTTARERRRALDLCEEIAGPRAEMSEATIALLERLATLLGVAAPPGTQRSA